MRRANHAGEVEPISVQIAGADPQMMAEAARYNVANGAQIIDINMGCPAKKVCNVCGRFGAAAGRAAGRADRRGGGRCVGAAGRRARHAEDPHRLESREQERAAHRAHRRGRRHRDARPCTAARAPTGYKGDAEYDTIAAVKARGAHSGGRQRRHRPRRKKRATCSAATGADAIMIGRAAQGRPWIFREIEHFLRTGEHLPPPRSRRDPAGDERAPRRSLRASTANSRACAPRASTSAGTLRGLSGANAFRAPHEHAGYHTRTTARRQRILRRPAGVVRPPRLRRRSGATTQPKQTCDGQNNTDRLAA